MVAPHCDWREVTELHIVKLLKQWILYYRNLILWKYKDNRAESLRRNIDWPEFLPSLPKSELRSQGNQLYLQTRLTQDHVKSECGTDSSKMDTDFEKVKAILCSDPGHVVFVCEKSSWLHPEMQGLEKQ